MTPNATRPAQRPTPMAVAAVAPADMPFDDVVAEDGDGALGACDGTITLGQPAAWQLTRLLNSPAIPYGWASHCCVAVEHVNSTHADVQLPSLRYCPGDPYGCALQRIACGSQLYVAHEN